MEGGPTAGGRNGDSGFALEYPEKVERLIIVNSVQKMLYSPGRKLLISLSRLLPFHLFVRLNIMRGFQKGYPKAELNKQILASQRVPRHVVMSCFRGMCRWDVSERLSSLAVKTFIVHGRYDVQFPLCEGEKLARSIPGAVLKVLECGHESPLEKPDELTAAICEALEN